MTGRPSPNRSSAEESAARFRTQLRALRSEFEKHCDEAEHVHDHCHVYGWREMQIDATELASCIDKYMAQMHDVNALRRALDTWNEVAGA